MKWGLGENETKDPAVLSCFFMAYQIDCIQDGLLLLFFFNVMYVHYDLLDCSALYRFSLFLKKK